MTTTAPENGAMMKKETLIVKPAIKPAAQPVAPTPQVLVNKANKYPAARELVSPSGFINTPPFTLKNLVGKKVILVDFWTYSCINCQRTLPYLNAWYDKYKNKGLEIVSIHTPEFDFEKKYDNVQAAVQKYGIKYPVVMDNDYATWDAYQNRYWPRKYLVDVDGYIVYDHIGEGGYEETEAKIQELLEEKMAREGKKDTVVDGYVKPSGAVTIEAGSPETYFGSARNTYLANGDAGKAGEQKLTEPSNLNLNELNLAGTWNFAPEYAENTTAGAKIIYRYQAKGVYLVGSAVNGVRARVLRDGKPLTSAEAGEDVILKDGQSYVTFKEDRLYKIIQDKNGAGEHTLEIIIEAPGLKAFAFTFG